MPEISVNYLAILVCGIASMVLGFLWYGPLFGKAWMASMGMNPNLSPAEIKAMQSKAGPGYAVMFIGSLVMAYVLTHVLVAREATTIFDGLHIGFAMWIGFVGIIGMSVKFFENKPWSYYFINRGYDLVNILIFSVILVSWK